MSWKLAKVTVIVIGVGDGKRSYTINQHRRHHAPQTAADLRAHPIRPQLIQTIDEGGVFDIML